MVEDITAGGEGKADVSAIVTSLQAIVRGEVPTAAGAAAEVTAAAQKTGDAPVFLDEFQYSVLQQSLQEGHQVLYVDVAIRQDCQLKAVRAYMVFDLLERSGEVVKSFPSVQDIEQEKFDYGFSLYYITQKDASEIQSMILNLSEIDKVTALALDQETLEQMVQDMAAATVEAPVQEETAPVAAPAAAPVREETIKAAAAKTVAAPWDDPRRYRRQPGCADEPV